jgi:hypothetical protein
VWFYLKQLWVYHCILVPWKKQKLKNASQRFLSLLLSHVVYVLREQRESCIGLSCHFGLQKVEFLCWYNLWRKKKRITVWLELQVGSSRVWNMSSEKSFIRCKMMCYKSFSLLSACCYVKVPKTWYLRVQDQTVALLGLESVWSQLEAQVWSFDSCTDCWFLFIRSASM